MKTRKPTKTERNTAKPHLRLVHDADQADDSWMVGMGDETAGNPRRAHSTDMEQAEGGEQIVDEALARSEGKITKSGVA